MILYKTWYKTHNNEFLAIMEISKICKYYLKRYKHKIPFFTEHNNLPQLMDTKSLSFYKVC